MATRLTVVLALAVFAAVVLVVASSAMAMRSWMFHQMDRSLEETLVRVEHADGAADALSLPAERTDAPLKDPEGRFRDGAPPGLGGPGSAEGELQVVERDGLVVSGIVKDFAVTSLSEKNLQILRSVRADHRGMSVDLDGLGRYWVRAKESADGTRIVVGQSTGQIDRTTVASTGLGLGLGAVVAFGAVFAGRRWISREMAPLARVAATARGIADSDLGAGEIEPLSRVGAEDARAGTEVGDVGQALNTMIDNVESALTARAVSESKLRQFVADASHELRTPLASIQGYTQLLQRDSIESGLALSRIASESSRMSGLVEDLLLLARLDAGRELGSSPVDLVPLAIDTVSDAHAAGPDHVWALELPEAGDGADLLGCELAGDEAALRQVFANLVSNARVHTPAGTRVVISVGRMPVDEDDVQVDRKGNRSWRKGSGPAGSVFLRVADSGPGIPEELRATVFDRFVRGDSSRTRAASPGGGGSSGLGLSIVSSITDALNGRVEMETGDGGTSFTAVFPRLVEV